MSIRQLPALNVPQPSGEVRWDLHPQAKAGWDRSITMAAADDDATISILEPIGVDFWTGEGVTTKRIAAALRSIGEKPVTVMINSPGGDFFEGLAIYNLLREHPKKVTAQILGIAASAASVIAMAADTIQIGKAAMLFVHNTQWFAAGDRHVMQQAAEDMKVFDELAADLYADRSGQPVAACAKLMDKETFLSGKDAVDQGFADTFLDSDAPRKPKAEMEPSGAYRIEALLEKHGVPRAERRRAMKEFLEVMPGADLHGMPGAAEMDGGLIAQFQAEAMRLRLPR